MPYEIKFTDSKKLNIVVEDGTINSETSVSLPGKNVTAYGAVIAENFLHILENFASATEPSTPVEGQLWYDSNPNNETLMVYNGVNWVSVNGVNKSVTEPLFPIEGDLWIDRDNLQLYMYTSSNGWILIGPQFSQGVVTGAVPKSIDGTDDESYNILQIDINAIPSVIFSSYEFVPKIKIPGFSTIKPGINLTSSTLGGQDTSKFYGIAEKAESLIVGNQVIASGNFLRSDTISSTSYPINVQNAAGINYGYNGEFTIGVEGSAGVLKSNVANSSIDFKVKNDGIFKNILRLDSSTIRVGINNEKPSDELDVAGNIRTTVPVSDSSKGKIIVTSTVNSTAVDKGSITTLGGLGVAKNLFVGNDITVGLVGIDYVGSKIVSRKLEPDVDANSITSNELYDTSSYIGTPDKRYDKIYAKNFIGDLEGTVTGSVNGAASSAGRLSVPTTFSFIGDCALSSDVKFTGIGGLVEFPVKINNSLISDKEEIEELGNNDELLVNNRIDGLKKVTVESLLNVVPIIPVGSIIPFAGSAAPLGWLLCDGSEYLIAEYTTLYNVIGLTFTIIPQGQQAAQGVFAVPDLRGRFPLGLQNMGSTTNTNPTILNDQAASILGATSGSEIVSLQEQNLPEHKHGLLKDEKQFHAIASKEFDITDPEIVDFPFYNQLGTYSGLGLKNTQGILTDETIGLPFSVVNPFMALNFIIYAG